MQFRLEDDALIRLSGGFCLLLLVAGCAERPEASSDHVETVLATADLQLGSLAGDGPEAFGRISGVLADSMGRIFVTDYQANEVRVFDSLGEYRFRFGREGSGPGEFRGPCCLAAGPNGALWVRDGGNHRYSAFHVADTGAFPVSTLEMTHADVNFMAPLTFSASGNPIDIGHRRSDGGGLSLVRFELSGDGRIADSVVLPEPDPGEVGQFIVTRETDGAQTRLFFYQPFAPTELVAHGPGGRWAHGISSAYALRLNGNSGEVLIRGETSGPPLSAEERERARKRIEEDAARAGRRPGQMPYGIPDRKPPLRTAFFDASGRLWVERSVPEGSPRIADLWTEDGILVMRVKWPGDVSLAPPAWVGKDWALGLRQDSFGVQYVVRLRF